MIKTQRRFSLDLVVAAFGLGSWLGVNGTFLQTPLLLRRLPEGWALPAWLTLAVQLGNLGLVVYALVRRLLPRVSDAAHIYFLLAMGTAALFLNAFLRVETVSWAGADRSLAFLVLAFCSALVGCTSSVLFYPYMRHFREEYLVSYLVGEGLSGLVPSVLALIQGVGGEPECVLSPDGTTWTTVQPPPLFDTDVFLSILGGLSIVSLLSFMYIHNTSAFDSERKSPTEIKEQREMASARLLDRSWVCLFATSAVLNCVNNGVLNAVQSYSCMPYGAITYHLAATLKVVADPAVCLVAVWLAPLPKRALAALLAAAAGPLAYVLATALLSPAPPLQDRVAGRALVVLSWLVGAAALAYARLWVAQRARRGGARAMRACGALGQLGSILGTLTMFLLVNFTGLFTQAPPAACPGSPAR